MPKWFVEERNMKGEYSPVAYYSKEIPSPKSVNGGGRHFRKEPVEVKGEHLHLSLGELQQIYAP